MRPLLCLGLLAAAPPALAACPTAADLERGLRLSLATGETEEVTRGPEGETVSRFVVGGYVSQVRLAHGVYPLAVEETENGEQVATPTTYSYATTPLPVPAPGLEVALEVTVTGDGTTEERHDYSFGAPVIWTYGSCSYEVIPVTTVHHRDGAEVSRDSLHYLTEFGYSYLAGYADGTDEDVYTYVAVEVLQ